ncbi:nucleotide exchange factor GrpE, partial [Granulicatella elegans]
AEEGQESDVVVQVFQKGYMLKDRVLRPAMVIVSQ